MHELGAGRRRQAGDVLGREGIEQLAERLDLLRHRCLREQSLDLGGDREIGCRARIEVAYRLALVLDVQRRCERVADGLERSPPRVAEDPNRYSHLPTSMVG